MIEITKRAKREKPVGPGVEVHASDRVYITDANPSTLRLRDGKVRGKAARRADKKRRQLERELAARRAPKPSVLTVLEPL